MDGLRSGTPAAAGREGAHLWALGSHVQLFRDAPAGTFEWLPLRLVIRLQMDVRMRPYARPLLAPRESRLADPGVRAAFALARIEQIYERGGFLAPPCAYCGEPTGGFCDHDSCCEGPESRAAPVCTTCDDEFDGMCPSHR